MAQVERFRTKVDWFWLVLLGAICVRLLWPVPAHLRGGEVPWSNLLLPLLLVGLHVALVRTIRYDVDDAALTVRSLWMTSVVPLQSISKLRRTRTLLAAPAMSLDRIEVVASKGPYCVISPSDKAAFVRAIRARVPHVVVEGL
jgi:hypothetical protein